MPIYIREGKKKGSYKLEVVSAVNGKILTTSRELTQKVSVFTNLSSTLKELGIKKGKVTVYDETVIVKGEAKQLEVKI